MLYVPICIPSCRQWHNKCCHRWLNSFSDYYTVTVVTILAFLLLLCKVLGCASLIKASYVRGSVISHCLTFLFLILVCLHGVSSAVNMWAILLMMFSLEYMWEQKIGGLKKLGVRVWVGQLGWSKCTKQLQYYQLWWKCIPFLVVTEVTLMLWLFYRAAQILCKFCQVRLVRHFQHHLIVRMVLVVWRLRKK